MAHFGDRGSRVTPAVALVLVVSFAAGSGAAQAPAPTGRPRTDAFGDLMPEGAVARLGTAWLRSGWKTRALALSADGRLLATQSDEGRRVDGEFVVRIWDRAEGRLVSCLPPFRHSYLGEQLAFTSDGKTLLTGNSKGVVRAWDTATGCLARCFEKPPPESIFLQFRLTPSGEALVGSNDIGLLCVWDVRSGKIARTISCRKDSFLIGLACAPDSRHVAVSDGAGLLQVWDATTGELTADLSSRREPWRAVAFSPDGKRLATGDRRDHVRIWDVAAAKQVQEFAVEGWLESVFFQADGRSVIYHAHDNPDHGPDIRYIYLRARSQRGRLGVLDLETGKTRLLADALPGFACVSADGSLLALASGPSVRLWQLPEGKEVDPRPPFAAVKRMVAAGGRLVTLSADGTLHFWDDPAGKPKVAHELPGSFSALAADPAGRVLAAGDDKGRVTLWSADGREKLREIEAHKKVVVCLAFSPDGKSLASSGEDGFARVWDVEAGKETSRWGAPPKPGEVGKEFRALAFAPDGRSLTALGGEKGLYRWGLADGKEWRPYVGGIGHSGCCYLPDAPKALHWGFGNDFIVRVEDLERGQVAEWETGYPRGEEGSLALTPWGRDSLALSPDGLYLAVGGQKGQVRVYEWPTRTELAHFKGHRGPVSCVAFSADGQALFSGSLDSTVLAWDLRAASSRTGRDEKDDPDKLWADLAAKAPEAHRALWALAGNPDEGVPFLRDRLLESARGQVQRLRRLVGQLGDDDFRVRQAATDGLKEGGPAAAALLRELLRGDKAEVEVRRRAEAIIDALDGPPPPGHLRQLRGLAALERMGTAEAWRAVEELAGLEEGTWLRDAARAALDRKAKRATPP